MKNPRITRRSSKISVTVGLAAAVTLALSSCAGGGASPDEAAVTVPEVDGDLVWLSWSDYVDPALVETFEEEYGVTVTIEPADSSENMIQKMASGQPYDVITGNSAYMSRMIEGELIRPFELDVLENRDNIAPYFLDPVYDSGELRYSVPWGGGPTGIVYRTDKVEVEPTWDALWQNAEAANGHIYILDQVEESIGMGLLRDGNDLNSDDPAEVEAAVENLLELKDSLGGISTDTLGNIGTGEAWIHHAWATDAYRVMTESPFAGDLDFVLPEEGAPMGMNVLNIGANASSPGTALLFIDFMLREENKVAQAEWTGDLTGSISGDAAFNEVVSDFPQMQIKDDFYENATWKEALDGDRQTLWSEEWNRFKAS